MLPPHQCGPRISEGSARVAPAPGEQPLARYLSQRKLAQILGIRQPQVARLEAGIHDPSFETLRLLSEHLGMGFLVDISPRPTRWIKSRPRDAMLFEDAELSTGTRVAVAAR